MRFIIIVLFFLNFSLTAQRVIAPSDELTISGKIKTELKFNANDFLKQPAQAIKEFELTNHKGESKGMIHGLKGFPLKLLLEKIEFVVEKPKELNEFYFTFISTDGYKVVFSWNEIFNTEVGNQLFLITEKDGKSLDKIEERILVVSGSDLKIGRRYIKGLSKIVVNRVE